MKDLGKLRCSGVSFSSFENNVLKVEGEDITSVQYRKIERTPGNDFDVVLSNPASVENIGQRPGADRNQKGESLSMTNFKVSDPTLPTPSMRRFKSGLLTVKS